MLLPVCVLLGVLSSASEAVQGPAVGEPPPAPTAAEMARTKAEEADELYQQGDLGGALARLREAFALYPSPKIHYNFGLVERALLRDVDAIASFERFLAEAPDADPARRADAARQVAELSAFVVSVTLHCDTPGAEAFIDGRLVGTTPLPGKLRVGAGPHQIVVQKEGLGIPFVRRIDGAAGSTIEVSVRLVPIPPVPKPSATEVTLLATPPARSEDGGGRRLYQSSWFWGGVGALVSVVAVSVAVMARAGGESTSICGDRCTLGELSLAR